MNRNYITTTNAQLYNNNGSPMQVLAKDTPFTTGEYVLNGKLYLGPDYLVNRWIKIGDYKLAEATPPPDPDPEPAPPSELVNIRKFVDGVCVESKYYTEYLNE